MDLIACISISLIYGSLTPDTIKTFIVKVSIYTGIETISAFFSFLKDGIRSINKKAA
jgi:hypothetical protein